MPPHPGPRRARTLRALGGTGPSKHAGRGKKSSEAASVTFETLQRTQHDAETLWRLYTQCDEYFTFRVLVQAFKGLPEAERISECRTEYEFILHSLNQLSDLLEVEKISKAYRAYYSPEVQLSGYLYSTLLTAFTLLPSYVLNGQEFHVSDTVLDQCQSLQFVFQQTCKELTTHFDNLQPYSLAGIRDDVKRALVYFDRTWCRFEMPALEEIEAIHRQACRPLIEAIEAERALAEYEQSAGGMTTVHGVHRVKLDVQRSRLMEKICALNRIANLEGHGRADMDLTCFHESERLVLRLLCPLGREEEKGTKKHHCGNCVSPVVARVAHSLLRRFDRLRKVLQKYAKSLYQVNSHLANNTELVRAMERFEEAWELADRYLVRWESRRLALSVYSVVIGVQDQRFKDSLVTLDPEFLINALPRTLLFHEMRRLLGSSKERLENDGSVKAKSLEGNTLVSHMLRQGSDAPSLPRPLDRTLGNGGNTFTGGNKQQTPFERAAISRTFLPAEMADSYNTAFESLKHLSESQLKSAQEALLGPAPGSSPGATPGGHAGVSLLTMHLPRPSISSHSRLPSGKNSGAATPCGAPPGTGQSQPPRTPCPPRIAVPSTPQVHPVEGVAQSGRGVASRRNSNSHSSGTDHNSNESDDEEEDRFVLDLAALQRTATAGDGLPPPPVGAAQESKVHDSAVADVVAALGSLSVHLQRAKAQEWNELIQVVLQGIHFNKTRTKK